MSGVLCFLPEILWSCPPCIVICSSSQAHHLYLAASVEVRQMYIAQLLMIGKHMLKSNAECLPFLEINEANARAKQLKHTCAKLCPAARQQLHKCSL